MNQKSEAMLRGDRDGREFDSKIDTLTSKKEAMLDVLKRDYEAKISSMERDYETKVANIEREYETRIATCESKKQAAIDKHISVANSYNTQMEEVKAKKEKQVPQTSTYRKLIADLAMCEREVEEANLSFKEAAKKCAMAQERDSQRKIQAAREEQDYKKRDEERIVQEAQELAEKRSEQEQAAVMERYRARLVEEKATPPPQIFSPPQEVSPSPPSKVGPKTTKSFKTKPKQIVNPPLDASKEYSYREINSIAVDYDTMPEGYEELYEKKCQEASIREKIPGYENTPLFKSTVEQL